MLDPDLARCMCWFLIGPSKIKIRTSLADKAHQDLWANEVPILIFDDPAEEQPSQCIVLLIFTSIQ